MSCDAVLVIVFSRPALPELQGWFIRFGYVHRFELDQRQIVSIEIFSA